MSPTACPASTCGYCRFYIPTGRRGGECTQLSVPVKAGWRACCLARSPFGTAPESVSAVSVSLALQEAIAKEIAVSPADVSPADPERLPQPLLG